MGLDQFGNPAGNISDTLFQSTYTAVAAGADAETMQVAAMPVTGGTNHSNGPKTNFSALWATMAARTSGQTNAYSFTAFHFANGDTVGLDGVAQSWGRNNAGGDEGTEAITVAALQGDRVTTGTVSAINGTNIIYSSAVNANVLGEDRPLIITTPAKVYSQGAIIAAAGVPPVITGNGNQDWTTLGMGVVSNLFLSIDSQTNGALRLVVPVRSITDANHLVLDYVSQGNDSNLPVPPLPSTYKLFRGGNVTAMPLPPLLPNSVVVAVATDFAVGDTFEQPLGYSHTINGIHLHVGQKLPFASNAGGSGVLVSNDGAGISFPIGFAFEGPVDAAFFADTVKVDGLRITNNPPGALVKSGWVGSGTTNFLGSYTSVGQNTFLSYDRSVDVWRTVRPFVVPAYTVANLPVIACLGARACVVDALAPSFMAPLVGGGPVKCPAFHNGAAWVAG